MSTAKPNKTFANRKLRTRAHVIEELSINYFQRHVLLCNFSLEKFDSDYGYDLMLFTYNIQGEIESGCIRVQMKASDIINLNAKDYIPYDINTKDLNLWLNEFDPVLLVIYDAIGNKAYWINIQDYFKSIMLSQLQRKQRFFRIKIPQKNKINPKTIKTLAKYKNDKYDVNNLFS